MLSATSTSTCARARVLAVVGPSGCGKSTLLRTLAGLLPVVAGPLLRRRRAGARPRRPDRALVFQDDGLLPWRTVRAQRRAAAGHPAACRAASGAPGRADLARARSGWPARRPPAARSSPAACGSGCSWPARSPGAPRAILMDEPFGALDAQTRGGDAAAAGRGAGGRRAGDRRVRHPRRRRGAVRSADRVAVLAADGIRLAGRGTVESARPGDARDTAVRSARRDILSRHSRRPTSTRTTAGASRVDTAGESTADALDCDVLVIGGGTAGTMAALTAAEHGAHVLLLEKAHVRHSGALAMGMDGVNNAVIPGKATPEDYVAEITRANDGIVNQAHRLPDGAPAGSPWCSGWSATASSSRRTSTASTPSGRCTGPAATCCRCRRARTSRRCSTGCCGSSEMRERITIENRVMPVRVLTPRAGRSAPPASTPAPASSSPCRRRAVILATGALWPAGPARQRLPLRHLREPDQRRRRLRDGLPRGRGALRHRVLPDQPADQGLQRARLRVRRQPVRRLPGQRRGRALRRLRLLVGADDGRGRPARSRRPAARSTSS